MRKPLTKKQTDALTEHAFKPGQSGNPAGKPKGSRSFKTVIAEVLELTAQSKDLDADEAALFAKLKAILGREPAYREMMAFRQVAKAIAGDTQAFNAVADREEGKPVQAVALDAEIDHSGKITVQHTDIVDRINQVKGQK